MKQVENLFKALLRRIGIDYLPRMVAVDFLGNHYNVRNGVIDDGDYDDAWLLAIAKRSKIIFDIGSNIGQSAFIMLHAPNVEKIVLVDPSPFALTIAADTLIRNQMSNRVIFINSYVSDVIGEKVWFDASGHSTGAKALSTPDNKSVEVPTITVDGLVEKLNIEPDFVKFDVEGLENEVLYGSTQLAARQCTRFMIEMHSSKEHPQYQVTQNVINWCQQVNYVAHYMKKSIIIHTPEIAQHRGRYHLLLQPASYEYPKWLSRIPQGASVDVAMNE